MLEGSPRVPLADCETDQWHEPIVEGRRYWYRWCDSFTAVSGVCLGTTDTKALFKDPSNHNQARVVLLTDVYCEDGMDIRRRRSWFW